MKVASVTIWYNPEDTMRDMQHHVVKRICGRYRIDVLDMARDLLKDEKLRDGMRLLKICTTFFYLLALRARGVARRVLLTRRRNGKGGTHA